MTKVICSNCVICAEEFNSSELQNVVLSKLNITNFKVCQACFDIADPEGDYRQVREIVGSYLESNQAHRLFDEVKSILNSIKK